MDEAPTAGVSRRDFLKTAGAGAALALATAVSLVARHIYQFEEKVWPRAAEKEIGLVAMKVFGGSTKTPKGARMPDAMKRDALRYALGLAQVSVAIVGIHDAEQLKQNLAWLKAYKPLSAAELQALDQPTRELARQWDKPYGPVT